MAKTLPRTPEQIPVYTTVRADRSPAVSAIVSELERGQFTNAALLADGMMRDDRIAAVLYTRSTALASLPLFLTPANTTRSAKDAVADLDAIWTKAFPDWLLAEMIRWGQLIGVGLCRVHWLEDDFYGFIPHLEPWHPRHIRWDWLEQCYFAYHTDGETKVIPGDGWFLYNPHGYQYGWRRGLLLSLANLWLMRQWTWRDWARASEVYGLPLRKAIVPDTASQEEKSSFLEQVANLGNESAIRLDQSKDTKFDLEIVEVKEDMHKAFSDFIDSLNASIAITVLGQNLSTEVKGGSFAAAQAHEQVRADRLGADAETMGDALYEQVIKPWALKVYGKTELAPYPHWEFEAPEDKFKKSQYLVTLSQALNQFLTAGAPIDTRATLEEFAIALRPEAETTLEPSAELPEGSTPAAPLPAGAPSINLTPTDVGAIVTVNEARASIGLAPLPGDEGNLTLAEFKARHSEVIGEAAAAEAGETGPTAEEEAPPTPPTE